MGAGSAKGVNEINDEDNDPENDRFSIISGGSPSVEPKLSKPLSKEDNEVRTNNIRAKMEALGAESEDDDLLPKSADDGERKEDERRRGLFGFSRKKSEDEKTNAFIHESGEETKRSIKRESSKGFKFFKFKKEDKKKSDEKDEKLDQEIKDLQQAFDSLGIVGSNVFNENPPKDPAASKKSQSADDIRELEPMRNRLNQKRRFSRPANAGGGSMRKGNDGMITSGGGKRRTFKYSWEKENIIANPVQTEDWNYEATTIEGFDVNKFKEVNKEGPNIIMSESYSEGINNNSDGWGSPLFSGTPNGIKSPPLTYDPAEQKLLASIEREFV